MPKQPTISLRQHLANLLRGKGSHRSLHAAVTDFPAHLRGVKPAEATHSAWQLLEHTRLAQRDILDLSRNSATQEKKRPEDLWPAVEAPPDEGAWEASLQQLQSDMKEMQALVADTKHDLLAPIPQAPDRTLLGQALLLADHNAYHLGQLMMLRKMLEA